MQTKLTLRLEEELIEQAKIYAKQSGKSVSQLVADYFLHLKKAQSNDKKQLPPLTQQLSGLLKNSTIEHEKMVYRSHLEDKYL